MGIIFKNTLNNVLANKRRSVLLVICMMTVAFSAMMAFSMSDTIGMVIDDFVSQAYGDAKVIVNNDTINTAPLELPDCAEGMYFYTASIHTQHHSADNFAYATKNQYALIGTDIAQAQAERYIVHSEPMELGENDIIITEKLADAENKQVGSTFDVVTADNEPLTLRVKYILKNERYLKGLGAVVLSDVSLAERLSGRAGHWQSCNIFIRNDTPPAGFIADMSEKYGSMEFEETRQANAETDEMRLMFTAVFIILTLIIFIVTSGVSEHMIRERMAQMGTLRSIGATRAMTAAALISENLFYSIPGAFLGVLVFIPFGSSFIRSFFIMQGAEPIGFHAKFSHIAAVFLITSAVSCLSSVKAVLKAVKTPIRDIIFGGKDSAYILGKGRAVVGSVMIIAAVFCGSFIDNTAVALVSILLMTVGSIFFIPLLISTVCGALKRTENPIFRISFNNIATKKTVMSSAVLFAVVIGLANAVFLESRNIGESVNAMPFSGNIVIDMLSGRAEDYRFISALDGVERAELAYYRTDACRINDNGIINYGYIIAYDADSQLFNGVQGIERELAADEISLDSKLMNAYNISEGDMVDVTFNAVGERPVELNLRAVKGCDTSALNIDRTSAVINPELYKKHFFDTPAVELVKLKEPAQTQDIIRIIRTYLMDKTAVIYSGDEFADMKRSGAGGITTLLYLIVGTGCLLSVIMLAGSLSIGFEQRKKELAVLHSTSMSRAQLGRMLFCETAFSLTISAVWTIMSGGICYVMLVRFADMLSEVPPTVPDKLYLAVILPIIMLIAGVITAAAGRNRINKMNTASEMKYE